jgi:hypothetical protein
MRKDISYENCHQSFCGLTQRKNYRPLKTKQMRNAEEKERMKKYPKTTIRVRFPDGLVLQINFLSIEKGIARNHCSRVSSHITNQNAKRSQHFIRCNSINTEKHWARIFACPSTSNATVRFESNVIQSRSCPCFKCDVCWGQNCRRERYSIVGALMKFQKVHALTI